MIPSIENKLALVSGASRGIGAGIALELARAGAHVAVNYCNSADRAREVAGRIESLGRKAMVVQADVANPADVRRMFQEVEAKMGVVDILVNNAGITGPKTPTLDVDEATYDAIMNTNLRGAFLCSVIALRKMQEKKWGRVINISSVHECRVHPLRVRCVYSMTKGGMLMMMREMAVEFSPYGITVNNIAPGAIRTDLSQHVWSDPAANARTLARIPAGFRGEPEDVGRAAVYLASDDARYVSGTTLYVDGGLALT